MKNLLKKSLAFAIISVFMLSFAFQKSVIAEDIKEGENELLEKAKNGDTEAQIEIGGKYALKDNDEEAFKWYKKAAESGDPEGQMRLYMAYSLGNGVNQNNTTAFKWLKKAVAQDYPDAMNSMGSAYLGGVTPEGKPDLEKTLYWYKKAAEQKHADAYVSLGSYYLYQDSVRDVDEAVKWYKKAAFSDEDTSREQAMEYLIRIFSEYKALERKAREASIWARRTIFGMDMRYSPPKETLADFRAAEKLKKLDQETGSYLMFYLKNRELSSYGEDTETIKEIPQAERAIDGYATGISDMAGKLFDRVLEKDAIKLYIDDLWEKLYLKGAPMKLAGRLLLKLKDELKDTSGFWLDYANAANLAGQPALALKACGKIKELSEKDTEEGEAIKDMETIIRANAMFQMGKEESAYNLLFERTALKDNEFALNYLNHWARPLLKDKKKLSFVLGKEESFWTERYEMPEQQAFHDIDTGNLLGAADKAAELKTGSDAKEEKPKAKILD